MTEIKFDYVDRCGEKLRHNIVTLEEAEQGINDDENYEIVARRRYTGLKDKNGVEIYEGDIVRVTASEYQKHRPVVVPIVWDAKSAQFRAKSENTHCGSRYYERATVIGNIYENPDLLEKAA